MLIIIYKLDLYSAWRVPSMINPLGVSPKVYFRLPRLHALTKADIGVIDYMLLANWSLI